MQFRVIVVTDPQTHKQTHRQDRLQYTVLLSLVYMGKLCEVVSIEWTVMIQASLGHTLVMPRCQTLQSQQ